MTPFNLDDYRDLPEHLEWCDRESGLDCRSDDAQALIDEIDRLQAPVKSHENAAPTLVTIEAPDHATGQTRRALLIIPPTGVMQLGITKGDVTKESPR